MILRIGVLVLFFFVSSCNNISFVYKDNNTIKNPILNNTIVEVKGKDLPHLIKNVYEFVGFTNNPKYNLMIIVEEEKTKRSVEVNQAASKIDHVITLNYRLTNILLDCQVYEKIINTTFTFIPKSSGYNYGTDTSLEKKYELAITENLNRFISIIINEDISSYYFILIIYIE